MVCFQQDIQESIDLIEKLVFFVRDIECSCIYSGQTLLETCDRCKCLDSI